MRNPAQFLLLCLLCFSCGTLSAQSGKTLFETGKDLSGNLEAFSSSHPGDRVYLQTDKPVYSPGEVIWLQAYTREESGLGPSQESDILHVELIDPRGNVNQKSTLPVEEGISNWQFDLNAQVSGGIWKLRAWTKLQLLQEDPFIFEKELRVRKAIYPELKMKLEFEEKAYGPGATVTAKLDLEDLRNQPLRNKTLGYRIRVSGQETERAKLQTDQVGRAWIVFDLPEGLDTRDVNLWVGVDHEGATESVTRPVPVLLNKLQVQFFPEGGEMVAGLPTKIGFEGRNDIGKAADFSGTVFDSEGNKVTEFKSYHMGRGSFEINPKLGESYTVRIDQPKGIETEFSLPEVQSGGWSMNFEPQQDKRVRGRILNSFSRQNGYLIAQIRGKVVYQSPVFPRLGAAIVDFTTEGMPTGVMQLTLFDEKGVEQAERLVFVNKTQQLNIKIETDKEQYLPREKVNLTLKATDENNAPVAADLSLAVIDDKVLAHADDKQGHLVSKMLLEPDLKGKIEEPNFYFDPKEEKADLALDHLLMTRGWRRFTWEKIQQSEAQPLIAWEGEKVWLAGYVVDPAGNPIPEAKIEMGGKFCKTDSTGFYKLRNVMAANPDLKAMKYDYHPVQVRPIYANQYCNLMMTPASGLVTLTYYNNVHKKNQYGYSNMVFNQPTKYFDASYQMPERDKSISENVKLDPKDIQIGVKKVKTTVVAEKTIQVAQARREVFATESIEGVRTTSLDEVSISATTVQADMMSMEAVMIRSTGVNHRYNSWSGASLYRVDGVEVWVTDGNYTTWTPRYNPPPPSYLPTPQNFEQIKKEVGYPAIAKRSGLMDKTTYAVLIDEEGRVASAVPMDPIHPVFASAIEGQLPDLKFKPGRSRGKKRPMWTEIAFDFTQAGARAESNYLPITGFKRGREFYSPVYASDASPAVRNDFRETIFFKSFVKTDENGEAKLSFYNSDAVTSFRATAEGMTNSGLAGHAEETYFTELPFAVTAKLPKTVSQGDQVRIPVKMKNLTGKTIEGKLSSIVSSAFVADGSLPDTVRIQPHSQRIVHLEYRVQDQPGMADIRVDFKSDGWSESFNQEVEVGKKGFPQGLSVAGNEKEQTWKWEIPNQIIPGSMEARVMAYPSVIAEALSGIESIAREPSGCFEQVTSSNFPNLLVMRYLRETGQPDETGLKKRITGYLRRGYQKLAGYEASTGGFDWYGRNPGNLRLSAYGLMQFRLMQDLVGGVNPKMIQRTEKWVMGHLDENGNFVDRGHSGNHGNQLKAKQHVTNSYLLYALTQSGFKNLEPTLYRAHKDAIADMDPYQLALVANVHLMRGETSEAEELMSLLIPQQASDGSWTGKNGTMTYSNGNSLKVETTALAVKALIASGSEKHVGLVESGIRFISQNRSSYGGFGNTQATAMALDALVDYSTRYSKVKESGSLILMVNGEKVGERELEKSKTKTIEWTGWEKFLKPGTNEVSLLFDNERSVIPVSLGVDWTTTLPGNASNPSVSIETQAERSEVKRGEDLRYRVVVKNETRKSQHSPIALIGIPGGFSLQDWQLKSLVERGLCDYFELKGQYLVLYYEYLDAGEKKVIDLDLKAEIPGSFSGPASSAYLYYNSSERSWAGTEILKVTN